MTTTLNTETGLLPVAFHGDSLFIVNYEGDPYVPMRPVVEGMGLAWQPQHAKLTADKERWGVIIIVTPSPGGPQESVCIPHRRLFGWLMTISPNKVKPELRQKIICYQRECDDVLWRYWTRQRESVSRQELGPLFTLVKEQLGHNLQSLNAAIVLQWLVVNQTEQRRIEISVRQLAGETGVSKSGVFRVLALLEGLGWLNWERDARRMPSHIKLLTGALNEALARQPVRAAVH